MLLKMTHLKSAVFSIIFILGRQQHTLTGYSSLLTKNRENKIDNTFKSK